MTALVVTSEEEECGRVAQFQRPQVQYALEQKEHERVGVNRGRSRDGRNVSAVRATFATARIVDAVGGISVARDRREQ